MGCAMFRLFVALLAIGAALPTDVNAQAAQPSSAQCESLAKYRDAGLYAEWSSVVGASGTYAQAMTALDEAYADVKSTDHALHMADAVGIFAHVAGTLSTLTLNLTGVRYKALERTVVSALTDGRFAIDWYFASDSERVVMLAQYMNDIAISASVVGRGAIAARDLALDLTRMTNDIAESESIHRKLDQQMSSLRRDTAQLQSKIANIDASLARLSGLKDAIDQACGSRGCPISGTATVSRKGSIACLVSSQASCPGCKGGWRHRCDATTAGPAWHPVDKCLPNELRNAKTGADRQKVASELFAAQSDALLSEPTNKEKAERRQKMTENMSMMADAVNKGSSQAAERNAYFASQAEAQRAVATQKSDRYIDPCPEAQVVDSACDKAYYQANGHAVDGYTAPSSYATPRPSSGPPNASEKQDPICDATGTRLSSLDCIDARLCKLGLTQSCH